MKKLFGIAVAAIIFTSCSNNKAEQERLAQQRAIDSLATVMQQQQAQIAQQRTIDSMNAVVAAKEAEAAEKLEAERAAANTRVANAKRSSSRSGGTTYVQSNAARSEPVEAKRKGWSGAAKGAVIGAGVGAIGGAVIDNKKGRGAIIGGLSGAGIGAGTGAILDGKKNK